MRGCMCEGEGKEGKASRLTARVKSGWGVERNRSALQSEEKRRLKRTSLGRRQSGFAETATKH